AADVEHLARGGGRARGEDVRLDDVVDIREVARLTAVAVDLQQLAAQRPENEAGDHRRVFRGRVLAWAEHVEIAQADGFDAVELRAHPRVHLVRGLRHS